MVARACFDMERRAYPQPAAFLSRRTCITPSTYVYTSFVSDLVLAKSVADSKAPRQALPFAVLAAYCVGTLPSLGHTKLILCFTDCLGQKHGAMYLRQFSTELT